jgi:hypothetical protein
VSNDHDAGAFIGHEPELAAERIPGGVRPQDERVAATQSESAISGDPDGEPEGDAIDVVEGPIGSASLKEPAEVAAHAAGLDAPAVASKRQPEEADSNG